MADIRSYLKEKEKREQKDQSYQTKIRKHKLSAVYRVLLVLLIVGAIVAVLRIQYQNRVYNEYTVTASTPRQEVSNTTDVRLGSSVLTYSKDGAHCTDAKGKVVWNQTYEMQNPMISVCGDVAAIGEYNGRVIYIQNASSQMGTINTNMPIRSLCVAANGVVGVLLEDSGITWIYIYDSQGNVLVKSSTTMKDWGYPTSISLSPNGILLAVSYLYMDTGNVKSSVAFYNFGEVGKNQTDNFMGGYNYGDTIIPYVQFMNNSSIFAAGDDRLVFFTGGQKPENISNVLFEEEVQGVYYSEQYVGLVFLNEKGNTRYRLEVYDTGGNRKTTKEFDMDYADIVFSGDTYIIYNETEMYIGTMAGADKFSGNFQKAVKLLIPTGMKYRYMITTPDSIDTIQMN